MNDTIVASATPPGRGGVAIVRLSGSAVPAMAPALLGALPEPRVATHASFREAAGAAIDTGLALYFPAPQSYTGEHVLELQGHGGPILVEALIRRALELGCRRAQPGEFTRRAYLNGKLDLAQAEAVADLIDASSEAAARAALRSLAGEFSARVRRLGDALGELRAYVEAAIDFADEEIDFLSDAALGARLEAVAAQLLELQRASRHGRLLAEGMTVVIAGRPNAGKSTLLNRLAGHEAAIVTPIAGTTRDVLREHIVLDGVPLHVLDTAGLRHGAAGVIEAEGIRRAQAAMASADRILFVIDAAADPDGRSYEQERARLPASVPVTLVFNKLDLRPTAPAAALETMTAPRVLISALTGAGLDELRAHLKACMGAQPPGGEILSARARHIEALEQVAICVREARGQLKLRRAPELVAEELKRAQQALGEILGITSSDDLLGRIFASFCVGK